MAKKEHNMNNMMYCFYYLCHEEAAIIKARVEVLQYLVMLGGIDFVCEYLRYNIISFWSYCLQPETHIVTHSAQTMCFYHCCQHNVHVCVAEKPKKKRRI